MAQISGLESAVDWTLPSLCGPWRPRPSGPRLRPALVQGQVSAARVSGMITGSWAAWTLPRRFVPPRPVSTRSSPSLQFLCLLLSALTCALPSPAGVRHVCPPVRPPQLHAWGRAPGQREGRRRAVCCRGRCHCFPGPVPSLQFAQGRGSRRGPRAPTPRSGPRNTCW